MTKPLLPDVNHRPRYKLAAWIVGAGLAITFLADWGIAVLGVLGFDIEPAADFTNICKEIYGRGFFVALGFVFGKKL